MSKNSRNTAELHWSQVSRCDYSYRMFHESCTCSVTSQS